MTIVHSQRFLLYRTYAADFCFVEPPLSDFICTQTSNIPYMLNFYRPQTKFAKVMFSQMSVCPQGRGCVYPSMHWVGRCASQHALGRGVCVSQHALGGGCVCLGGVWLGGYLPGGAMHALIFVLKDTLSQLLTR